MESHDDTIIKFNCENCNKKIGMPTQHAGKKIKCPSCQSILTIPKQEYLFPEAEIIQDSSIPEISQSLPEVSSIPE